MIDRDLIKKISNHNTCAGRSFFQTPPHPKKKKKKTANDLTWTFQKAQIHLGISPACN